jgi:hypothetical protein
MVAKVYIVAAFLVPATEPAYSNQITLGAILISATLAFLGIIQILAGGRKWKPMVERAEKSETLALAEAKRHTDLAEERAKQVEQLRLALSEVGSAKVYDAITSQTQLLGHNHQQTLTAIHELALAIKSDRPHD